ncbi:MAG: zinc metalloprotease HtpX [Bacteroidota bacterium]
MWNTLKVGLLLTALTALFVLAGQWLGGPSGALIALVLALVMNAGSYWFSDKMVLKATRAQPLTEAQAPEMHRMVERLSERAGIPKPRLYLVPDPQPNAFATGRNPENGVVAVNEGLVRMLTPEELEGVIAHEIGHIKHRDTLTMAVAASISGAIMVLVNIAQFALIFGGRDGDGPNPLALLAGMLIAPIAASVIQMAISRAREFEADTTAADLTGSSRGLIGALQKLERGAAAIPATSASTSNAHMRIVNPLSGKRQAFAKLFMTHPPVQERVEALHAWEAEHGGRRSASTLR